MVTKLNPTGRTVTLPVPLKDEAQPLGDVLIQITAGDQILVEKAALIERLAAIAEAPVLAQIEGLPAQSGFVAIETFAAAGIKLRFDSGLQELSVELSAEERPTGDLNFGAKAKPRASAATVVPEAVSGYLNVIAGLDQLWDTGVPRGPLYEDQPSARLELESAVRAGGVVIENRAALEGETDAAICPETAICTYGHVAGLKRQSSRAVYDFPDSEIRVTAGDTDALAVPMQRATDLLGLSIEKSPRKLNPGESISSNGGGAFRLERSAMVEVRVNGSSVQTLHLKPGTTICATCRSAPGPTIWNS